MRFALFAVAASAIAFPLAAHADLIGDSIHVVYAYPDQGIVYQDYGTVTVPGSGLASDAAGNGIALFQITGSQIIVTDLLGNTFIPANFTGLEFTDLSKDPGITGVTFNASESNFNGIVSSFTSNEVFLNFSGLTAFPGDTAVFDLTFAPPVPPPSSVTPEPSSFALLGTGLLGVAGTMRRRFVRS